MSLPDWREKIKPYEQNLYFAAVAVLIVSLAWGLINLFQFKRGRQPIRIENGLLVGESGAEVRLPPGSLTSASSGNFVASKNGSKYYPVDCQSANRIKNINRLYFATKEAAERGGYEPAANCP